MAGDLPTVLHDDLGCASYLIGDEDAGVAAVVDPRLDIEEYLRPARFLGVRIEHILETHNQRTTSPVTVASHPPRGRDPRPHARRRPATSTRPFDDGWELELGELTVRALHTPGHRPEHTAFA